MACSKGVKLLMLCMYNQINADLYTDILVFFLEITILFLAKYGLGVIQ